MTGSRTVSPTQMEILISFMENHPDFAKGRINTLRGQQLWTELINRLNSANGTKKSVAMWKKYWHEKKYLVKKRLKRGADDANSSFPFVPPLGRLSSDDTRLYNLLGLGNPAQTQQQGELSMRNSLQAENPTTKSPSPESLPANMEVDIKVEQVPSPSEHLEVVELKASPVHFQRQQRNESKTSILTSILIENSSPASTSAKEPIVPSAQPIDDGNKDEDEDQNQSSLDDVPQWAIQMEERKLRLDEERNRIEERKAAATERIASTVALIRAEIVGIRTLIETRPPH